MENTKVIKTRAYGLSSNATVFQAELQAISLGCGLVKGSVPKGRKEIFMVDSQAAIKALDNFDTQCTTLKLAKEALSSLGSEYQLEPHWVKAHVNNKGNDIADRAAKTGCKLTNLSYKCTDRAKSKDIYNMSKHDLGILVRYTTGHVHLRRHNKILGTLEPRSFGPTPEAG